MRISLGWRFPSWLDRALREVRQNHHPSVRSLESGSRPSRRPLCPLQASARRSRRGARQVLHELGAPPLPLSPRFLPYLSDPELNILCLGLYLVVLPSSGCQVCGPLTSLQARCDDAPVVGFEHFISRGSCHPTFRSCAWQAPTDCTASEQTRGHRMLVF